MPPHCDNCGRTYDLCECTKQEEIKSARCEICDYSPADCRHNADAIRQDNIRLRQEVEVYKRGFDEIVQERDRWKEECLALRRAYAAATSQPASASSEIAETNK